MMDDVSASALAYLGDSVAELLVREMLVRKGVSNAGKLNEMALSYVRASEQSKALKRLIPLLNEEETAVCRRGKNISHHSMPKNVSQKEYREATAFEAVFGYLFLCGREDRIRELFSAAFPEDESPQQADER
ncbi:MAG: Mini-ribonuclease 3 [Clostridia bacterium]|nr:Mini-ribonuclease 3 [Clostridia bacterium]